MFDWKKITHLPYWLFLAKKSGLEKLPKDDRDFNLGIFGWGEYKPKHKVWINPTLSTKNQGSKNTCAWNGGILMKEPDEGIVLSVRKFVTAGLRNGLISGNGFANLRSPQIILQKVGAEPEGDGEDINDWNQYTSVPLNLAEAAKHKIASFWTISSKYDIMKVIDDGKRVATGIEWFTGFNQGGGFAWPWLITRRVGLSVGGHAVDIIGYELNYQGRDVFILKNSYGKLWGDSRTFELDDGRKVSENGLFYVDMDYMVNESYGFYVNMDIEGDVGKFISQYDGKNVKGKGPSIYFIQKGVKKAYPDEVTYLAYNVNDTEIKKFEIVDDATLSKIPTGDNMDIKKSLYWDFLKDIKPTKERVNKLMELILAK